jgi:hypothetical protein
MVPVTRCIVNLEKACHCLSAFCAADLASCVCRKNTYKADGKRLTPQTAFFRFKFD